MRNMILSLTVLVSLGILSGCSGLHSDDSPFEEGEPFPQCLVGVWKSDDFGWAFKFEPDGSINKLRHMIFRHVDMAEPEVEMVGPSEDTFAMFSMGDCTTHYEPETRTLEVTVILDDYVMQLPHGVLAGRENDYFTGQVSDDCQTWNVEWRSYSWLDGATPPDPNLIEPNPEPLVFTKVDLSQKPDPSDEPHDHM